jgi:thioredoxin 1
MMKTVAGNVSEVTDDTFADEILSSALPVHVDFTADWYPGCRMIAPMLAENGEQLRIVSLNVDHNPRAAAAYGVLAMPTLMLFRAGQPARSLVGARSKQRLMRGLAGA